MCRLQISLKNFTHYTPNNILKNYKTCSLQKGKEENEENSFIMHMIYSAYTSIIKYIQNRFHVELLVSFSVHYLKEQLRFKKFAYADVETLLKAPC